MLILIFLFAKLVLLYKSKLLIMFQYYKPDYAYFPCDNSGHWYKNDYGNEWVDYGPCLQSIIPVTHKLLNKF